MERSETPHDPRDLGVPSGASKMMFEPMVRLTKTVHLSCVKISTISKRTETSFHLSIINYYYQRVRLKRFLSRWYVWRKPCTYLASRIARKDRNELPLEPRHLVVPSSATKMISEAMVCQPKTMHLYCTDTNSVSKQKVASLQMTYVT